MESTAYLEGGQELQTLTFTIEVTEDTLEVLLQLKEVLSKGGKVLGTTKKSLV